MGFTVYDTADLPPEHRFEWWRETVSQGAGPTSITSDHPAGFTGSMGVLSLGIAQIATMSFPTMRSERTPRLIRRSDPETYELTLVLDGSMGVSQARREALLVPGHFNLWSSSRPYSSLGTGDPGAEPSRAVVLHLPRALVPLPEAKVDRLLARALPSATGVGAVFARHLGSVVEEAATFTEGDGQRLGVLTWDLATAFLAHHLDASDRLPPHTRHQLLLTRLDLFIDANLADPYLSPPVIAARHHISVRLLHRLFAGRRETVAESIRRRRLERCSADLVNPVFSTLPVHAVARRWGFTDAAGFSRAFRTAYGVTPREHRLAPETARACLA
ncbi:helix-turn-helix domain-containing protein [Streptomyces sp. Isolate_45]|uniref:AraC-like ligand-binding domain-containing protein n=1 Tax=Streptomyces sp. Isolate_45 TaxID=2950111 RepID=UPI002481A247|nr:helix-turn-helix domain-containing protein [Streptomyces sp. Isolate_45]MDA5282692.1 helix-turn-helix domain-containing protein [Streptomyces sp. Isolate_45]